MTIGTTKFNEILMQYYADYGRHDLPWRQPEPDGQFDPYKIMVSELMLQQTQVARVIPKFNEFLINFPSVAALATASLGDVLIAWSGLGYNRRAKFLWQAAQAITAAHNGRFPQTLAELVTLPGVGKNTAGAILAYAYNQPVLFLETNIRTVYIHHFFHNQTDVPDVAMLEVLNDTLDHTNPREFYWALMDYGTYLKKTVGNLSRHAKGYAKQSRFEGSRRQIRGQVLKLLAAQSLTLPELADRIPDERLAAVVTDLLAEKLITRIDDQRLAL
jgi:A/G-specific adenine glycosylase